MADKIDVGEILLPVKEADLIGLEKILMAGIFDKPNLKISVYKNRRGKYKGIMLWCKADLGTCRINPMFCTDYTYNIINIEDLDIEFDEGENK